MLEMYTDESKPVPLKAGYVNLRSVVDAHKFGGQFLLHHQSVAVAHLHAVCFWWANTLAIFTDDVRNAK